MNLANMTTWVHTRKGARQRFGYITIAGIAALVPAMVAAQAAQPVPWKYSASIYGYAPSVGGSSRFPAEGGSSINVSAIKTHANANGAPIEIKEWQGLMDHLQRLPVAAPGELPVIPVDARAAEVRATQ